MLPTLYLGLLIIETLSNIHNTKIASSNLSEFKEENSIFVLILYIIPWVPERAKLQISSFLGRFIVLPFFGVVA